MDVIVKLLCRSVKKVNVQMLSNKGGYGDSRLQTTRYVTCVIKVSTRMQHRLYMDKHAFAGSCGHGYGVIILPKLQIHKMDINLFDSSAALCYL